MFFLNSYYMILWATFSETKIVAFLGHGLLNKQRPDQQHIELAGLPADSVWVSQTESAAQVAQNLVRMLISKYESGHVYLCWLAGNQGENSFPIGITIYNSIPSWIQGFNPPVESVLANLQDFGMTRWMTTASQQAEATFTLTEYKVLAFLALVKGWHADPSVGFLQKILFYSLLSEAFITKVQAFLCTQNYNTEKLSQIKNIDLPY